MSKRWVLLLGVLALCGLVACQSTAAPTGETASTATLPVATATEVKAEATATGVQKSASTATPAPKPGATPTPPWQIPEVRDSDWSTGAEDAGLVIVEYSEFQ